MTQEEFKQFKKDFGLSYADLAEILGVGLSTVFRYNRVNARIPERVAKTIEYWKKANGFK